MKKGLVKLGSFLLAALLLAGCAGAPAATSLPEDSSTPVVTATPVPTAEPTPEASFDRAEQADVVIVGAGGGGMAAALEAVAAGANSVVLIDKLAKTGGALNTTAGTMSGAETIIQELDGLTEDSLESYKNDILKEGSKHGGVPNVELVEVYVKEAKEAVNWLWENGLKDYEFNMSKDGHKAVFAPEHTLFSYPRSYKAKVKNSEKYVSSAHEILDGLIANEPKIKVVLNTFAEHLAANEQGQVLNVEAIDLTTGETVLYKANRGVLMSTGGYAANAPLINHFAPEINGVVTGGMLSTDGYGIRMIQEVGGRINEASMGWVPTNIMGLENPNMPGTARIMSTKTQFCGGIFVNKQGQRFVNENAIDPVEREEAQARQTDGVQFEVFTDKIAADVMASSQGAMFNAFFAKDAGKAFILEGNSLDELAAKMGVPADTFKATVEAYNKVVDEQGTDEFGRVCAPNDNPYNLGQNKIEGEKYYAVITKPIALLTMGGVETNASMQVLSVDGTPIPGLFAAGECVGGVWGKYVSSGCGVMGPISFGRVAARSIMSIEPTTGYVAQNAPNMIDLSFFTLPAFEKAGDRYDMSKTLKDGSYTATVDGQEGPMTLKVEIAGGKIAGVTIVEQHETAAIGGPALDSLPTTIVTAQSVNGVDSISGATLTSDRIFNAVIDCLDQAAS